MMQAHAQIQDRHDPLADLVNITNRLIDLITAEIAALRAMRPKDIRPLQDEKAALASRYERELTALRDRSAAGIPPEPRLAAELRASTGTLNSVLAENRQVLEAARTVNGSVMKVMADEISRQRNPGERYGPRLGPREQERRDNSVVVGPISLDAQI